MTFVRRAGSPTKGELMFTDIALATCPRCGAHPDVFVRSVDGTDLVCDSCRESRSPLAHPASPLRLSRRPVGAVR